MPTDNELDTVIDALCSRHRRDLVGRLRQTSQIRLSEDREFQVAMVHSHLPKLAQGNFIEYEQTEGGEIIVQRGERWNEIKDAHAALCEKEWVKA